MCTKWGQRVKVLISSVFCEKWRGNKHAARKDCVISWEIQGTKHTADPELHFLQSIFVSEDASLIPELKQAALLPDLSPAELSHHFQSFLRKMLTLSLSPLKCLLLPWIKFQFQTRKSFVWNQGNEEMKISSNHKILCQKFRTYWKKLYL